ncbi:bifunctional DNA-formamidopyrimidine glycosylase/DNA-(apurinic or apyrimidinic site) lyase [Verticiella sediminum]|uniref:Formamidopyrimidine-DNA glycosylase n=1 Tax=Verticiella sediminum TaxID=1247510 RepID=A0A556B1E7_9BURK|nr:bifunctional DNA-formamidopyrimidine glycosylase/DNA-(apurinic or apyrimidinic site) lyase [Verticiella sediminum]TSH99016.1 bifunctional DNA-formamidopyrimidine glycosylase/DNA-(apurinic or apyrimidinic site) lyase [Verticiella sediminum]
MPELPEVEVTRRGIAPHVEGAVLRRLDVRDARLRWPVPPAMAAELAGRTVREAARRGKYLLLRFDNGTQLVHLGMSGSLRVVEPDAPPGLHDHVDWVFDGLILRLRDPRRFGAVLWHAQDDGPVLAHPRLATLGIEPFDPAFDGYLLHRMTRKRATPIKQALLGGEIVVGVGNIYASESLFRAGIHPRTPAGRLSLPRCLRLADEVKATLAEAIAAGGSSLRDFVHSDGSSGYFQIDSRVYGREGLPCRACATPIKRIVQFQRATFYCPRCQKF